MINLNKWTNYEIEELIRQAEEELERRKSAKPWTKSTDNDSYVYKVTEDSLPSNKRPRVRFAD